MNNPYLDEYREIQDIARRGGADKYFGIYSMRGPLVAKYAYAVPDEGAIDLICKYSPIVEMGAGTGYWASLIADHPAGDVIAYDNCSSHYNAGYGEGMSREVDEDRHGKFHVVWNHGPEILKDHADRTLLLCWPPYAGPMAYECLRRYQGDTVIYVGEGYGGCTGDDKFHALLEKDFDEIEHYAIPQWDGIRDDLTVHRRK